MKHVLNPVRAVPVVALALALALPLIHLSGGLVRAAEWTGETADQMISFDDNEYARYVQIAGEGFLHVLWAEDAPTVREIHYGRSDDEGTSWTCSSGDRVISFQDGNAVYDAPSLVQGLNGRLLAVWSEDFEATREVHYGVSSDQGATWSCETQDQILSAPSSAVDTGPPSAAIDGSGVMHVVWNQNSGTTSEVYYSRSTNGGQTWSGSEADRAISFPDGGNVVSPKIACSDDRLVVVWRETGDGGLPVIHGGCSTDGGNTWSCETADHEISQPATLITSLAVDAGVWDNGIHVVYAASFDTGSPYHYEIFSTSSSDGFSWSGETELTPVSFDEDHTRSTSNPDVFVHSCGSVLAAWDERNEDSDTEEIHYSVLDGGVWSGATMDQILSFPDGENGYRPSITGWRNIIPKTRDPRDVWVAWSEFAGDAIDNYEVHLSASYLCDVGDVEGGPVEEAVFRVAPNPSNGSVRFEISAGLGGDVEIFDAAGRLVRAMSSGVAGGPGPRLTSAGAGVVTWDGADRFGRRVPAGLYWARIRTAGGTTSRPVVIL